MQRRSLLALVVLPAAFMLVACGAESGAEEDKDKKADEADEDEDDKADKDDKRDKDDKDDKDDEKDKAAKDDEADEAPSDEVILEEMDEPYLGKMLMPKGAEASMMSDKGGHYKLALSADGYEAIYIDYETVGGAKTLAKAKGATKWTAPGNADIVTASTNETGIHVVELKRDSDKKIFVLGFRPDNYIKCWGPAEQLENCKKIINSIPMPAK